MSMKPVSSGAGAAAGPLVKLCPILTAASIAKSESPGKVLGVMGQPKSAESGLTAVACQGPSCMFFLPVVDDSGRVNGGNCAITLMPTAISMLNGSLREFMAAAVEEGDLGAPEAQS